jgi:uncharacterized membrane protein YphA (DoxX/SURF4 family)
MAALARLLFHRRTIRTSQVLIGGLLAIAALAKLGDLHAFAEQIHNFRLLPWGLENLSAIILPWVELVAGLALVLGVRARAGGVVAVGLMAVFTVAVLIAMARGLDIECGCFGTGDATRVGLLKVVENSAMLAMALAASLRPR